MTMQCRELREIADSYLAEELLVETNHDVLRHLEECPACRGEVLARRQLRGTLRRAFTTAEALQPDPDFTARVSGRMRTRGAEKPAARRFRIARWWAIAAGLVIAVMAGRAAWRGAPAVPTRLTNSSRTDLTRAVQVVSRDAAGDHRDCALHFRLAETPISLEQAARAYDVAYRTLDEAVRSARDGQGQPFEVVEGHVCVFAGRRFAHIVLRLRGRLVSVLVAERTAADGAVGAGDRAALTAPDVIGLPQMEGFSEASFAAPRHWVFVVSELDAAANLAVARAVAKPVYQHLAGA